MPAHPLLKVYDVSTCSMVERINRFTAEIILGGRKTKAYLPNTGRLTGYLNRGNTGFCIPMEKPKKLRYRLIGARKERGGGVALIDTQIQTKAFERALELGLIPWLGGWSPGGRNVRLGTSLIDYLFSRRGRSLYLEVKSSVWRERDFALYPDCPTERGQRHLRELTAHVERGGEGVILFIVALRGAKGFRPYRDGDPKFFELLVKALDSGAAIKSLSLYYNPKDSLIYLENPDLNVVI